MDPYRLVGIAVDAHDLARLYLARPWAVIEIGVDAPARMVGHKQEGIVLGTLAADALVVRLRLLDPFGHGLALLVVGEEVCQAGGVELDLARGGFHGVVHGILVELDHAGRLLVPALACGQHLVALALDQLEVLLLFGQARSLVAHFLPFLHGHVAGQVAGTVLVNSSIGLQLLCYLDHGFVV